jgi:hypothetical protein
VERETAELGVVEAVLRMWANAVASYEGEEKQNSVTMLRKCVFCIITRPPASSAGRERHHMGFTDCASLFAVLLYAWMFGPRPSKSEGVFSHPLCSVLTFCQHDAPVSVASLSAMGTAVIYCIV